MSSANGAAWVPYRHACIASLNSALGLVHPALPKAPITRVHIPFELF